MVRERASNRKDLKFQTYERVWEILRADLRENLSRKGLEREEVHEKAITGKKVLARGPLPSTRGTSGN